MAVPEVHHEIPPLSRALYRYFNFGYFILLCPSRLTYNAVSGRFLAVPRRKFFQVLYVFLATVSGLVVIGHQATVGTSISSATSIREGVRIALAHLDLFGWLMAGITFKLELWRAREHVAELLNLLASVERQLSTAHHKSCRFLQHIGILAIALHAPLTTGIGIEIYRTLTSRHYVWGADELIKWSSCYRFVVGLLLHIENQFILYGPTLFCLLCVTYLGLAIRLGHQRRELLSYQYELNISVQLLKLSTHIKQCFGFSIVGYLILPLTFYTHALESCSVGDCILCSLNLHDSFILAVTLVAGSEAHARFTALLSFWTSTPDMITDSMASSSQVTRLRCNILLSHVSALNAFGVGGRVLTLTYAFAGAMAACIIGYSISIVQLQGGS